MEKLDYKNINSFAELIENLKPLIKGENFDWLKPIINSSLDKDVLDFLAQTTPVTTAYYTLDLSEHISQLTEIINKNIKLRNEIFEVESIALNTAIDLIQVIEILESDTEISELSIKANLSLVDNQDEDKYILANSNKIENIKTKLYTKIHIHNQKGNPLNYGERASQLRKTYCENIKIIYERLIATKRVLKFSYKIETTAIPNFLEITNNLDLIVNWVRDALYRFEISQQESTTIQKSISLGFCSFSRNNNKDLIADLKQEGSYISFRIEDEDIEQFRQFKSIRLIGLSINILEDYVKLNDGNNGAEIAGKVNQETLKEKTFYSVKVITPQQDLELELDSIYTSFEKEMDDVKEKILDLKFRNPFLMGRKIIGVNDRNELIFEKIVEEKEHINFPNELFINDIKPIYKTSVNENLNFNINNQLKNIYPIGKWALIIKNQSLEKQLYDSGISNIKDIILTFKLAVI